LPWTHHDLVALVEPFARRGRHVDLAASRRLERQLVFKAVGHAGDPGLRETLQLDNPAVDVYRLTRVLADPSGLEARLVAQGPVPAALLDAIDVVPAQRQFDAGAGFALAFSHRLPSRPRAGTGAPAANDLLLTAAVVAFDGFRLAVQLTAVKGIAADAELRATRGDAIDLPQDLLAVLGWHWSRLTRRQGAWTATLQLRGSGVERGRDAERKLIAVAGHLARTLGEDPARFHARWRAARWVAAARRAVPLLACIVMCIAAAAVPQMELQNNSVLRMLVFQAPPLLLALYFGLGEMPRIEIPPWPRQLTEPAWRRPFNAASADAPTS
jgi:hypothetical protein